MDRQKIKQHAAVLKEAEALKLEAVTEAANHVREGSLTREEAAQCVAGAMLRIANERGLSGAAGIKYAQLLVDQELDGEDFAGLAIGRHV